VCLVVELEQERLLRVSHDPEGTRSIPVPVLPLQSSGPSGTSRPRAG
jgi:hypothetical protein